MATDCLFKINLKLKEPIESKDRWITYINIPCGKCARCIERRKMEWAFRMEIELEKAKTAYFVTLTYRPEKVPYNKYGQKTLKPNHLTNYFKRLRQNQKRGKETIEWLINGLQPIDKIKYYAAGEYGEDRGRPHYHAIIFNASIINIEKSWKKGTTHIVQANEQTISYVMKYLDKRLNKEPEWKKTPEYNTMSEGIGIDYIQKNKQWHTRNIDVLFVTKKNGIKIPMPKYYREKIFSDEQRKEQVEIVTDKLLEINQEETKKLGQDKYNKKQITDKYTSEYRFNKKIKKRLVD